MARRRPLQRKRQLAAKPTKEAREWIRVHESASRGRRRGRRSGYISPEEATFYAPLDTGPLPVSPEDIRPTPAPAPAREAPLPKGPAYDWDKMFEDWSRDRVEPPPPPPPKAPPPVETRRLRREVAPAPAPPPPRPTPPAPTPAPVPSEPPPVVPTESRRAPTRPKPAPAPAPASDVELFDPEEAPAPRRRDVKPRPAPPPPARPITPSAEETRTYLPRGAQGCRFVVLLPEDESTSEVPLLDDDEDADADGVELDDDVEFFDDSPDFESMDGLAAPWWRGTKRAAKKKAVEKTKKAAAPKTPKKRSPKVKAPGEGPRARAAAAERESAQPEGAFVFDGRAHASFKLDAGGFNGAIAMSARRNGQVAIVCGTQPPFGVVDCGTGDCFPAGFRLKWRREIPKGDYVPGVRGLGNAQRERDREARVTAYVRQATAQARAGARAEAERLFGKAVAECRSKDAKFWICDRVREVEAQGGLYAAAEKAKKQGVNGTPKRRKKR